MTRSDHSYRSSALSQRLARPPETGVKRFDEQTIIRRFFRSLKLSPAQLVLDVACGYGNKLAWLVEDGYSAEGVDINPDLVAAARKRGFQAMTVDELARDHRQYDAMLMAHIVEHFTPPELLAFVDYYLDRLSVGGHLIISTPLEWNNFYDDFDHTKSYHPNAFMMVFSQAASQVQYHSRNRLSLVDLGLRRIPKRQPSYELLYSELHSTSPLWRIGHGGMDRMWRLLFRASGGVLGGQTNGWIGLFKKTS